MIVIIVMMAVIFLDPTRYTSGTFVDISGNFFLLPPSLLPLTYHFY